MQKSEGIKYSLRNMTNTKEKRNFLKGKKVFFLEEIAPNNIYIALMTLYTLFKATNSVES